MGYIFMTPGKIKSLNQLSRSYDHNMRYRFCQNTDEERRDGNKQILFRPHTYAEHYKMRIDSSSRYNGHDATKIRKDAVRAIDLCVAVSKSELETNPYFSIDEFCEIAKKWICDTFGEENVAGITLHMDEHSPHLHAIIIPMTKDGRLCCSDFIGTPQKLSELQDSIAKAMEPLHLKRGMKKSVAEHKTMKQFYGAVNEAMTDSLPAPIEGETAKQYAIRANIAFNKEKAKHLASRTELVRERDEAVTLARQVKDDVSSREEQLSEREKTLNAMQKKIDRNSEALGQWGDIVYAIKRHLLSPDKEKELLGYMQEALNAAKEERESSARVTEKETNITDEDN